MNRDLQLDKEKARGKDADKGREGDVPRWHGVGYHRSADGLDGCHPCVLGRMEGIKLQGWDGSSGERPGQLNTTATISKHHRKYCNTHCMRTALKLKGSVPCSGLTSSISLDPAESLSEAKSLRVRTLFVGVAT